MSLEKRIVALEKAAPRMNHARLLAHAHQVMAEIETLPCSPCELGDEYCMSEAELDAAIKAELQRLGLTALL